MAGWFLWMFERYDDDDENDSDVDAASAVASVTVTSVADAIGVLFEIKGPLLSYVSQILTPFSASQKNNGLRGKRRYLNNIRMVGAL